MGCGSATLDLRTIKGAAEVLQRWGGGGRGEEGKEEEEEGMRRGREGRVSC